MRDLLRCPVNATKLRALGCSKHANKCSKKGNSKDSQLMFEHDVHRTPLKTWHTTTRTLITNTNVARHKSHNSLQRSRFTFVTRNCTQLLSRIFPQAQAPGRLFAFKFTRLPLHEYHCPSYTDTAKTVFTHHESMGAN